MSADLFAKYFKPINNPESQFYRADEDIIEFNRRFLNTETQAMFAELDMFAEVDVEIIRQEIVKGIGELTTGRS